MSPDPERLRRLFGGPETAWLLDRLRKRIAAGRPLRGTVTLTAASTEQRRAVERLLGRRAGTGGSLSVSLDEIDGVLRRSGAAPSGLNDVVALLVGPVLNRVADAAAWASAVSALDALLIERPELKPWRDWLDSAGMMRRLAPTPQEAADLIDVVTQVLTVLPAAGGIALGSLAAQTTGSAHGLDDGEPAATLVLAAARVLRGGTPVGNASATARRAAWAAVGVYRDDVSSTALCVGLPGDASPVGRVLAVMREAGEPCVLTLRQLGNAPVDLGVGNGLVYLCENPIVVASAADDLRADCPPLVSVGGHPSAAVRRLLELLEMQGASFAYHGDFDWGGLAIANALREHIDWKPWRFGADAYRSAEALGKPLIGRPVSASWDPCLRPAMEQRGSRLEQELVLADLLADLRHYRDSARPSC